MVSKILMLFTMSLSVLMAGEDKLFFGPCSSFSESMKFDCYRDYEEVAQFLTDAHAQYPNHTRLESIGKSYQGRDLWVLTVTNFSTGAPEDKPAIWVDGGVGIGSLWCCSRFAGDIDG